ncbi:MAG: aminoglycoside phosphotransferase family protein [bacterium]
MQENKITDLLDCDNLSDYFLNNLSECYDNLVAVNVDSIKPIKKQVWLTTYHVVVRYNLSLIFAGGQTKQKIIYTTAHDHEARKQVLDTLRYLVDCGFGEGKYLVPYPLFFDEQYNATFYEGVVGENLYHYIKTNDRAMINVLVDQTARWFAHLHNIHNGVAAFYENQNRFIETVSPGYNSVLSLIEHRFPQYANKYKKIYAYFINSENKYFKTHHKLSVIHGDAHPENVIHVLPNKVAIIDFVDMSIGDRARDIGSFLQQLDYMTTRKIGDEAYVAEVKMLFLTSYLKYAKIKQTNSLMRRIDMYYNFTAIRTASFFLLRHDSEPERAAPLIEQVCKNLDITD